jgi:hypothetical protein
MQIAAAEPWLEISAAATTAVIRNFIEATPRCGSSAGLQKMYHTPSPLDRVAYILTFSNGTVGNGRDQSGVERRKSLAE